MNETVRVLDHGSVTLVQSSASDLAVVAAARVSHGVTEEASKGETGDRALIRYLLRHDHGTPFEHNLFTFLVKAPIFVVREWHRHRIGWSYNEVSGRYTELPEEFYVPREVRVPAPKNRQGSVPGEVAMDVRGAIYYHSLNAFETYDRLLSAGVARELARLVLPLNVYTSFYASCNARSLMHFLTLRQAEGAQWEIRQYAHVMATMFEDLMPITAQEYRSKISASTPSTDSGVAPGPCFMPGNT